MHKHVDGMVTVPHTTGMDAIVAGHLCLDLTPGLGEHSAVAAVDGLLRPGSLVDTHGLTVSPGGAVANTGLSLARMGVSAGLVARVGTDPLADMLRGALRDSGGPDTVIELVADTGISTSFTVVLAIPGVDRIFLHDSGANDSFSVEDLRRALEGFARTVPEAPATAGPRVFHFGYPTAMASMYRTGAEPLALVLEEARRRGMTVSLDFSLPDPAGEAASAPWRAILSRAMPLVDICFPSVEELSLMLDRPGFLQREARHAGAEAFSPDYGYQLAGELLQMGAGVVVVKLGARGVLVRWDPTNAERLRDTGAIELGKRLPEASAEGAPPDALVVPGYPAAQVVSTTGAGDSSIAGVLAALLEGASLSAACEVGCLAGRNAVMRVDAVSGARSLRDMESERLEGASRRAAVEFERPAEWHRREDSLFYHRIPVDSYR
ncbi:MAG: carbohydrate kinase family protein [Spirochaetaceae bacterium]|nr:MAG: carbohydrate kinase family protein [Spirochaetaceae bacterium]